MQAKITKRVIDLAKPKVRDWFIWDTETKGFGLKVTPGGSKVYVFQYRWPGKKTPVRKTIGKHGDPWTADQARAQAEGYRGDVKRGIDPRHRERREAEQERAAITISDLCDQYLAEGCGIKKPSTLATDRGRIERHIKPLLGKMKVKDVTSNDIRRFMTDVAKGRTAVYEKTRLRGRARVTGGKGTASRTVGLLGGIFTFALSEGLRSDNPVRGVKRFPDRKGQRFLSAEEFARLGKALAEAEAEGANPMAIAGIRILLFTGCRKSEILTLKWNDVDLDRCALCLTDTKTGERTVPLGAPVLELLASLPRFKDNPYVLPGQKIGGHLVGLPRVWEKVRARAGLTDVRLHDLRHSFASVGAGAGMGLIIVGSLMGHRDPKTTVRYAHVAENPAKAAADRIAGQISAHMNGDDGADVVDLKK